MCGLDAGAIGKGNENAVGDGLDVGAGAGETEKMGGAAGVSNGGGVASVGLLGGGEGYRI